MKIIHVFNRDSKYNKSLGRFIWLCTQVLYDHSHEVLIITDDVNWAPVEIQTLDYKFDSKVRQFDADYIFFHDFYNSEIDQAYGTPYLDIKYTARFDAFDDNPVVLSNYLAFEYPGATVLKVPGISYQGHRLKPNCLAVMGGIDEYRRLVLMDLSRNENITFVVEDLGALTHRDLRILGDRLHRTDSRRCWVQADVAYFDRSDGYPLDSVGDRVGSCFSSGTLPIVYGVGAWKEYLPPNSNLIFLTPGETVKLITEAFNCSVNRDAMFLIARQCYETHYSANTLRNDLQRLLK